MLIELLELKNDYTFKRVFGYVGNESITMDLLSAILKEPVSDVILDCNKIIERDVFDDKLGILDVRAKINGNIDCDIEMQVVDQKNVEKRILFYLSKMYSQNIKKNEDYKEINKCIVILFVDFNIKKLECIDKYISKWNLREEKYSNIILTDAMEIYIIEMQKVKDYSESKELDAWVRFISNVGDFDMNDANREIKKAKEVLEEISDDEYERYLAHLREKYILDQNNLLSTGYDRGLEQGLEQGKKENNLKIAKSLKSENIDIQIIIRVTGLAKEDIEKL